MENLKLLTSGYNFSEKNPGTPPPNTPTIPSKPNPHPDPTTPRPGKTEIEKNNPTKINEPAKADPTKVDNPPIPKN